MLDGFMHRGLAGMAAIILGFSFTPALKAYGPVGHELVGAIADERLANTKAGEKVNELLQGITLKKASVIADEIKGWDKSTPDDPKSFHYSRHPQIDAQLTAFWKANPPTKDPNSAVPSHHWFHYTDVPLVRPEKYEDGSAGRTKWDVVHMIDYCIDVLRGKIPEENERKITKPMAVILLAHFVGDIHQPLHVGAEYFDAQGNVTDPDKDKTALPDEGGNSLNLEQSDDEPRARGIHKKKFHGFWDTDTVNGLLPALPETESKEERHDFLESAERYLVHEMATHEPSNWKVPAGEDLSRYPYDWANEILPIAREAHQRLVFKRIAPFTDENRVIASGDVEEKPGSASGAYRKWATEVVREEIHKGGWRLADILEKSLAEGANGKLPGNTTPVPSGH
jgi:S1/P1 Nuclease